MNRAVLAVLLGWAVSPSGFRPVRSGATEGNITGARRECQIPAGGVPEVQIYPRDAL